MDDLTRPTRKDDPLPIVEGWAMDLYCQYDLNIRHDMDTHGVSYGGNNRADARRQAKAAGWILHRNGFATCPRCAAILRSTAEGKA